MTLFLFILFANLLALIPASFAPTSHIAVTAILALAVFITRDRRSASTSTACTS